MRAFTPKTEMQKRVVRLSATLSPIDFYNPDEVGTDIENFFMNVEDAWSYNNSYGIEETFRDYCISAVIQRKQGFSVIRYLLADMSTCYYSKYYKLYERYHIQEIAQRWISPDGQVTLLATDMWDKGNYYWRYNQPLKLRDNDAPEYKFPIYGVGLHDRDLKYFRRHKDILKYIKSDGCNWTDDSWDVANLKLSTFGEWMDKCHHKLWKKMMDKHLISWLLSMKTYERQMQIAYKHGFRFTIRNIHPWVDYVRMLEENGKDTHSPFYLCPKDLKHAHDWITKINQRRLKEEDKQRKLRDQKEFEIRHSYLFNIRFNNGKYFLNSLDSVQAYIDEGEQMHHCVGGYYTKHTSLILHVQDGEGNKIATAEVDVKNRRIVQLRTICNEHTWEKSDEYQEIHNLINEYMGAFPYPPKEKQNKQTLTEENNLRQAM